MTEPSSKYLIPNRLEDVLACIQMFASERSGKKEISLWAERFARGPSSAESKGLTYTTSNTEHRETRAWKQVLEEHPEFFIIETDADGKERASLLMRRAYDKVYDSYQNKELTAKEINDLQMDGKPLSQEEKDKRIVRKPLSPDQIQTLMTAAIELHDRAIARKVEARWRYSLLVPALSGLFGALLGALASIIMAFLKPGTTAH